MQEETEPEDPIATIARERFRIPQLAPLQRFAIANIFDDTSATREGCGGGDFPHETDMETHRQLVLFPTGFGKSICFQLPALMLEGLTVVVYPLLALMNDQRRRLDEASIPCALFRGGLSDAEWAHEEKAVASGKVPIIIANPEILAAPKLKRFLASRHISHFVIDEAHCIAEWGETFRPSYLALGEIAQSLNPSELSAFTATAGPDVIASIEEKLFLGNAYRMVSTEADRSNVLYGVVHTLSPTRTLRKLALSCKKPAIIFDRSRPGVRMKTEALRAIGYANARFYHAGLSRKEREDIESWFQGAEDALLVSTNAYGMGMDKKNIRTVIHTSLPDSPEAYIQEAGRGGRDGQPAAAILIDTIGRDASFRYGEEMSDYQKSRSARLAPYPALTSCRREFLLNALGERETPVCGRCDNCLEESARREGRDARHTRVSGDGFTEMLFRTEGFMEAVALLGKNPRSFNDDELAKALSGRGCPTARYFGVLPDWTDEELRELAGGLRTIDITATVERGPWKGKIGLTERGRLLYRSIRKFAL